MGNHSETNQQSTEQRYVWKLLDQEIHILTLSQTYAPVGLLEMITVAPRRVLDIGCFVGATGKWLKERFSDVIVIGVEPMTSAAKKAQEIYDKVYNCRFEEISIKELEKSFDLIIAADVLEHMINPWKALELARQLITENGFLLVSLPNIRNLRIIEMLIGWGEWVYEGAGILDITHLRFFTRRSALRMFHETGWKVLEIRVNLDPRLINLIQGKDIMKVNTIDLNKLTIKELQGDEALEFFVLQWLFKLKLN